MAERSDKANRSSRRRLLQAAAAGAAMTMVKRRGAAQEKGQRPEQDAGVKVVNPQGRVPVSFIIDDSTCLVNLAHFGIPHFHEAFPSRYKQDWRKLPREIPDSFVREFAGWCRAHGVKGKYSVVPYPACVGWLDRDLPGWAKADLDASLKLLRDELAADWDFHPEMISHTWAIDLKTGRPYPDRTSKVMENWGWSVGRSVDELTAYLAYALRILKNVGIECEGITTPGGFGTRVLPELAQATLQSCRDVFAAEIPHYFRHLYTGTQSVAPRVEYASGLGGRDPRCVVSILGCTGDWFGGWDGLSPGSVDKLITRDRTGGRLPEVIARGEPAVMVCHWPGIYFNGEKVGFKIFQEAVRRLHERYDNLLWMKLSEIARYWAAKELTRIARIGAKVQFAAPFAAPRFTVELSAPGAKAVRVVAGGKPTLLKKVTKPARLVGGTWMLQKDVLTACFDLPRGKSALEWT